MAPLAAILTATLLCLYYYLMCRTLGARPLGTRANLPRRLADAFGWLAIASTLWVLAGMYYLFLRPFTWPS